MNKSYRYIIASVITLSIAFLMLWVIIRFDHSGIIYSNGFSLVTFTQYLIVISGIISLLLSSAAIYHCLNIYKPLFKIVRLLFVMFPLMLLSALLVYSGFFFLLWL